MYKPGIFLGFISVTAQVEVTTAAISRIFIQAISLEHHILFSKLTYLIYADVGLTFETFKHCAERALLGPLGPEGRAMVIPFLLADQCVTLNFKRAMLSGYRFLASTLLKRFSYQRKTLINIFLIDLGLKAQQLWPSFFKLQSIFILAPYFAKEVYKRSQCTSVITFNLLLTTFSCPSM